MVRSNHEGATSWNGDHARGVNGMAIGLHELRFSGKPHATSRRVKAIRRANRRPIGRSTWPLAGPRLNQSVGGFDHRFKGLLMLPAPPPVRIGQIVPNCAFEDGRSGAMPTNALQPRRHVVAGVANRDDVDKLEKEKTFRERSLSPTEHLSEMIEVSTNNEICFVNERHRETLRHVRGKIETVLSSRGNCVRVSPMPTMCARARGDHVDRDVT
jgi:hypothetical protein